MAKVKIGIAGAGAMGRLHAEELLGDERVQIVAIAEPDAGKAREFADRLDARPCADMEQLISAGVDAVIIATPNVTHAELAVEALHAGVHVYTEQPTATTLEDAVRVREAAQSGKGIYMVAYHLRFAPAYVRIRSLIDDGRLRPFLAHIKSTRGELVTPPGVGDASLTGGFIFEHALNHLDAARWLLGEVTTVRCLARTNVYTQPDDFVGMISFAGDRHATLAASAHAAWIFPNDRIELIGAHAMAVAEDAKRFRFVPGISEPATVYDYTGCELSVRRGFQASLRAFIDSLESGGPSPCSVQDGVRAVELALACYQSAETDGQPVEL
jgi:predicted dehydrogenase